MSCQNCKEMLKALDGFHAEWMKSVFVTSRKLGTKHLVSAWNKVIATCDKVKLDAAPSQAVEPEVTISSKGKSFSIKKGIMEGKIWIECEDGEGGDFNQDELYQAIRKFYDERF